MTVELRPYAEGDLALTEALETDPQVMKELGGPRNAEDVRKAHRNRVTPTAAGERWWFVIVPEPGGPGVGQIGIWQHEWEGDKIYEIGWTLLPSFQGRGVASQALGMLLERARQADSVDAIHALPGVTNAPSNGLCRKFGFELVEEREIDFLDRRLRVNHWVLELASRSPDPSSQAGTSSAGMGRPRA